MDKSRLYELGDMWERELFRTKPKNIEDIGLYPIVHNDGEGHINGYIEISLITEEAFASFDLLTVSKEYTDAQSCEESQKGMVHCLSDYLEKFLCDEEMEWIWQQVNSGDIKWHKYKKYSLPFSSYKEDHYGLYDAIRMCEVAIFLTRPICVKRVKLIPYFDDLGFDDDSDSATLLISLDVKIEKEEEYNQFTWTGTADGYGEERSKEEAEDYLALELKDIIDGILSDEEIQNFWEDVPWDKKWKKKKTGTVLS